MALTLTQDDLDAIAAAVRVELAVELAAIVSILVDTAEIGAAGAGLTAVKLGATQDAITWGQQKIVADVANQGALDISNSNASGIGQYNHGNYIGAENDGVSAGQFNYATGGVGEHNLGDQYGQKNEGGTDGQFNLGGGEAGQRNKGTVYGVHNFGDTTGQRNWGQTGYGIQAAGNVGATDPDWAVTGDAMTLTVGERTTLAATLWNALVSGLTTVGSIGKRIVDYLDAKVSSRATPSDVTVSLAVSATEAAAVASGTAAIKPYHDWSQAFLSTVTADLASATKIWTVGKADRDNNTDAEALFFIEEAEGLTVLAQAACASTGLGALAISGSSGDWEITVTLSAAATGALAPWRHKKGMYLAVKALVGGATVDVWEGTLEITSAAARAYS